MAVGTERILDGIAQLDTPDLETFLDEVSLVLAQRKAPSLSHAETALLQQINSGLPDEVQQRYNDLRARQAAGSISAEEHQTLLALIDVVEQADVERMQALMQLAQLRNLSLQALMEQLAIEPPPLRV